MPDRYTKIVLTIIAACLVWNVFTGRSVTREAWSATALDQILGPPGLPTQGSPPVRVIIDGWTYDGELVPNRLSTHPLPVKTN